MIIRSILVTDAPKLLALWTSVYEEGRYLSVAPAPKEEIDNVLDKVVENAIPYIVAMDGGNLVGAAEAFPTNLFDANCTQFDSVGLLGIQVSKGARGKGIGKLLMTALLDDCARFGYKSVELGVLKSNTVAISLYKTFEFQVIGDDELVTLPNGKSGQGLIMKLNLSSNPYNGSGKMQAGVGPSY